LSGPQKILGLMAELAEIGPGRQISHDVSLIAQRPAPGPEENATFNGLLPASGGGLCPARGPSGTLQRLTFIVSARADPSAMRTAQGLIMPDVCLGLPMSRHIRW
jgi:hypothetical protein